MSLIVPILGMHRSGTSCLTHLLRQAGLYLGPDLMTETEGGNLEGHWESREALRINEHVLRLSGGAWDQPPAALQGDEESARWMARFIQDLSVHPVAGWKDPRTVLTFPLWRPHLAAYHVVACFRHPLNVAQSLAVRDGWPLERGLRLWADYVERLLDDVADAPDVFWFDYDAADHHLAARLEVLCRRLGLRFDRSVLATFNPFLRHHRGKEPITDPRIRGLYDTLCSRAAAQALHVAPANETPAGEPPLPTAARTSLKAQDTSMLEALMVALNLFAAARDQQQPRDSELARRVDQLGKGFQEGGTRLAQLARVLQLQNSLQQEQSRALAEARNRQHGFEAGLQALPSLDQRVSAVEQAAGGLEQRIAALEQHASAVEEHANAVEQRVDAAEQHVAVTEQRIEERLANLKQEFQAGMDGLGRELHRLVEGLTGRLEKQAARLEHQVQEQVGGLARELNERLAAMARRLEESLGCMGQQLEDRAAALRQVLGDQSHRLEQELDRRVGELGERLADHAGQAHLLADQVRTLTEEQGRARDGVAQLEQRFAWMRSEAGALREQQEALAALATECQGFISQLQGSLSFRVRHALGRWAKGRFFHRTAEHASEKVA